MRVGLVDVDSKIPNLALMKLSAYHKARGDSVGFYDPEGERPDLVYASKVFDFTPDYPDFPEGVPVIKGGTGYGLATKLPEGCDDRTMPDYGLYGCGYAMGRFTRGCPNSCPWCVVPKTDGNAVRKVADLADFWDGPRDRCDCFKPIRLDGRGHGFVNARKFYLLDKAGLFDDMEWKKGRE